MTAPTDAERRPPDNDVQSLVARCISAIEAGDPEPVGRVCADHPELEAEVREQLTRLRNAGLLIAPAESPDRIGPYRVLHEIGRGGMGSVYLAEQSEPVRRRVALKLIRSGLDSREIVARFEAERQALALMNHPSIAQVYDAGTTVDGRPYFVMEYVPGEVLTSYCDDRHLDFDRRLRLFAEVCRAVQHAHEKGIIHRDIKPSNVLVVELEGRAVPKVIDFGIAKATGPAADDTTLLTRHDQVLGTPEYMSPEQACSAGTDVDVRTDVYSLGVVLYQLLTGELPFEPKRLRASGMRELERILLEETPPAPSSRLTGTGSQATVDAVRRLRGELDWVVLKALEKDRSQRYASALMLADDLERHLRHEPVSAGPPSLWYRLRKFTRRYRAQVIAAAAVLIALVAGLVVSVRFSFQASARAAEAEAALRGMREFFDLARGAVNQMLVRVGDERLEHVPQAESVRRELLEDALEFFLSLQARQPADPDLRAALAAAHSKIALIYRELGRVAEAEAAAERGCELLDELRDQAVHPAAHLRLQAGMLNALAMARGSRGKQRQAAVAYRAAIDALEAADSTDPANADPLSLARISSNLGMLHADTDPAAAKLALMGAARAFESAGDDSPKATLDAALTRTNLGEVLADLGEFAESEREHRAAIDALDPSAPGASRVLAVAHDNLGDVLDRLGRTSEAIDARRRSVSLWRELVRAHPGAAVYRTTLAGSLANLGNVLGNAGQADAALECLDEAVELREQLFAAAPDNAALVETLARTWSTLGSTTLTIALRDQPERLPDAERALRRALDLANALDELRPEDADVDFLAAAQTALLATVAEYRGDVGGAIERYRDALGRLEALAAAAPNWAELRYHLCSTCERYANALRRSDRVDEADAMVRTGIEHLTAGLERNGDDVRLRSIYSRFLAVMAHRSLELGELDVCVERAEALANAWPENLSSQMVAAEFIATCGIETADPAERERLAARAVELLRQARAAGFTPESGWELDTAFEWLRERDDFKAVFQR